MGFVTFSRSVENWWGNPYISQLMKYAIGWESNGKSTHTMGKVWVSIFQTFSIPWVLLQFPIVWETDGKNHAFSIWWSIPQDWNLLGKKHLYDGKSMSINFPDLSHTMGFVAFSHTVGNRWETPCISQMMTLVSFFLCIL